MISGRALDKIRARSLEVLPEINAVGDPWHSVYVLTLSRDHGGRTFRAWIGGALAGAVSVREVETGAGFYFLAGDIVDIQPTGEIITPKQAGHRA